MRYVPNLIPDKSKVLPDYFKGDIYKATKENPIANALLWILGIFFLISALVSIEHPVIAILFGLIGFILLPPGHRAIQRNLQFRLTPKIRTIATSILFIASLPLSIKYAAVDRQSAHQQKLADENAAKEKAITEQGEQARRDSLSFYIQQGVQLAQGHNLDEANKQLQHARTFASLPTEVDQIEKEHSAIAAIKASDLVNTGKFEAALTEINALLNSDPSNSELIYYRALCYSKTGKIEEAVNDLKPLIQAGNAEAEKLHEKVNPIRKRVAYYVTRCCDGTTSNATGRGACSHHGGVCNWNDPVYEEYRKYE